MTKRLSTESIFSVTYALKNAVAVSRSTHNAINTAKINEAAIQKKVCASADDMEILCALRLKYPKSATRNPTTMTPKIMSRLLYGSMIS